MPLDPELAAYLEAEKPLPPRVGMTLTETRARIVESARINGGTPSDVPVDSLMLPGNLPAREYRGGQSPLLVYFHGGRFISGNLDSHDRVCRRLALAAKCRVLAIDYRLA
ncbi:MAG TPA: alpha/beta hydrolase, partial [Bryobacteraceae bacterium]